MERAEDVETVTTSRSSWRRFSFWIGVALIAASFGIYPAYPVIALLPVPANVRVLGVIFGSLFSWTMFALGSALAGREGITYLKRLLSRGGIKPP
jgi:hypothetical protein